MGQYGQYGEYGEYGGYGEYGEYGAVVDRRLGGLVASVSVHLDHGVMLVLLCGHGVVVVVVFVWLTLSSLC